MNIAMVSPFDLKSALLARHAQHVVLIHFPIALFIAAVAFDYAARWSKSKTLETAAYLNLLLAAVSTVPVVLSGLAAWQWALGGQKLKGILLMHLTLGCVSAVLIWLVFLLHRAARRSPEPLRVESPPCCRGAGCPGDRIDRTPRRLPERSQPAFVNTRRNRIHEIHKG